MKWDETPAWKERQDSVEKGYEAEFSGVMNWPAALVIVSFFALLGFIFWVRFG